MNYFDEYLRKHNLTRDSLKTFFDYDPDSVLRASYTFAHKLHEIDKNARIVIFSDYDCDGLMAGIVAYAGLQLLGFKNIMLADRVVSDGYAFTLDMAKDIIVKYQPELVITCDVGITANSAVNYLHDNGVKVFVTDHHKPDLDVLKDLKADVIVDYVLDEDFITGDIDICGAVTIYECFRAYLNVYLAEYNSLVVDDMRLLEHFAAVATMSDTMPVLGSNRERIINMMGYFNYLISSNIEGFEIRHSNDSFIQKLFVNLCAFFSVVCNEYFTGVDEDFMNFSVIPVINSIKRMNGSVADFYHMFLFGTKQEAVYYAKRLLELNTVRKNKTAEVFDEVYVKHDDQIFDDMIYTTDEFSGLYGLVAQQIMSVTGLPTVVMNATALEDEDGFYYSGSVRSPQWFPFHTLVNESGLAKCAGHEVSCGVTVRIEDIYDFYNFLRKSVNDIKSSTVPAIPDPFSAKLESYDIFMDLSEDFYETLHNIHEFMYDCKHYGPFGNGFPAPTICIKVHKNNCSIEGLKYDPDAGTFQHTKVKLGLQFQALLWNVSPKEVEDSMIGDYYYFEGKYRYSYFQDLRNTDFVANLFIV